MSPGSRATRGDRLVTRAINTSPSHDLIKGQTGAHRQTYLCAMQIQPRHPSRHAPLVDRDNSSGVRAGPEEPRSCYSLPFSCLSRAIFAHTCSIDVVACSLRTRARSSATDFQEPTLSSTSAMTILADLHTWRAISHLRRLRNVNQPGGRPNTRIFR